MDHEPDPLISRPKTLPDFQADGGKRRKIMGRDR